MEEQKRRAFTTILRERRMAASKTGAGHEELISAIDDIYSREPLISSSQWQRLEELRTETEERIGQSSGEVEATGFALDILEDKKLWAPLVRLSDQAHDRAEEEAEPESKEREYFLGIAIAIELVEYLLGVEISGYYTYGETDAIEKYL